MTDTELIEAAQEGDRSAFSQLVERYHRNVRACLAVRLNNKMEADDLAQEAFLVAYRKINDFDNTQAFGPWIRSIAFYLLKNYWRKHKPEAVGGSAELQILIDEEVGLQYSDSHEADSLAALKLCITKLDQNLQDLIKSHYHDGLTIKELTQKLGIKHSAMTMKLHRMRDQLRRCINETKGSCQL